MTTASISTNQECGICLNNFSDNNPNGKAIEHGGPYGKIHRAHKECLRGLINFSGQLNCPLRCGESFPARSVISWGETFGRFRSNAVVAGIASSLTSAISVITTPSMDGVDEFIKLFRSNREFYRIEPHGYGDEVEARLIGSVIAGIALCRVGIFVIEKFQDRDFRDLRAIGNGVMLGIGASIILPVTAPTAMITAAVIGGVAGGIISVKSRLL